MRGPFRYHVRPDPDRYGWIVTAEGYVTRSLAFDTKQAALSSTEDLVRMHPGSTVVVDEEPPTLSPTEIEHRLAA
jgi:hypothetical protein